MSHTRAPGYTALLVGLVSALNCAVPGIAASPPDGRGGDFIYRARPGNTLIGLARRLLLEPRRWSDLQRLNRIADPRRIPLGTEIHIPYAWLRMSTETALAANTSGTALSDGKPLAAGTILSQGSRIVTGPDGSVTLDLADGSVVTLQKSSALRLQTLQRVSGEKAAHDLQLKLEKGRIQTAVRPHGDVGRFEIETPVAISAVRGTRFRTAFDPATRAAQDETLEGAVAVSGAQSAVSVSAGFGTRVGSDGVPHPPVRLLAAPDLSGVAATNLTSRLRLEWPPVAGAIRYRVQLAPAQDFHTILADVESTSARVSLPAPLDGAFWLRIRAIDPLGLEGFDATKAMTEHRLPPPPKLTSPRPDARITGTRVAFAWSGATVAAHYRWQLARAADFPAPLMVREVDGEKLEIEGVAPGRYVWRVATIGAHGEAGEWSAAQPYTQRPRPPVLQSPKIGRRTIELRWSRAVATRYHIQLSRDPGFARLLLDREVAVAQLPIARPRPGIYYARVQIVDGDGTRDPFGPPRRFEVPVPMWVRVVLPLVVVALALSL